MLGEIMNSINDGYRQMLAQAERTIGELNALKSMTYEPQDTKGGVYYQTAKRIIDKMVDEIRNNFCQAIAIQNKSFMVKEGWFMTYLEAYMKCDTVAQIKEKVKSDIATALIINTDRIKIIKESAEEALNTKFPEECKTTLLYEN